MTLEIGVEVVNKDRKRLADGVSGGISLISLSILLYTGWW